MDVTNTYEFIGFGAMDVTNTCEFMAKVQMPADVQMKAGHLGHSR